MEKTLTGRIIAFIVGGILTVTIAEISLRVGMPSWRDFYSGNFMRSISVPGYGEVATGIPGFDGYFAQNNGDFRVKITINEFGLRNSKPLDASDHSIWVIGDSMAFGWGVEENEMYSSVLQTSLEISTYNIASPGTNVCGYQALLARMSKNFRPRAVVLGLILENDVIATNCQHEARQPEKKMSEAPLKQKSGIKLKDLRRLLTANSALYNFFAVSLKRVDMVNQLLTKIGIIKDVHHYRRPGNGDDFKLATNSTADEILRFKKMLPENVPFVVLIAPGRFEIKDGDLAYSRLRNMMNAALEKRDINIVDPIKEFLAAGYQSVHFLHDGHWSPLGHKIAGRKIAAYFKANEQLIRP